MRSFQLILINLRIVHTSNASSRIMLIWFTVLVSTPCNNIDHMQHLRNLVLEGNGSFWQHNTVFLLLKANLACPIRHFISSSHLPSSVMSSPSYVKRETFSINCSSIYTLACGLASFLLTTIVFVLFTFIFIPKSVPTSLVQCSSVSDSAVSAVSSAYLSLLSLLPPTETPQLESTSLKSPLFVG